MGKVRNLVKILCTTQTQTNLRGRIGEVVKEVAEVHSLTVIRDDDKSNRGIGVLHVAAALHQPEGVLHVSANPGVGVGEPAQVRFGNN